MTHLDTNHAYGIGTSGGRSNGACKICETFVTGLKQVYEAQKRAPVPAAQITISWSFVDRLPAFSRLTASAGRQRQCCTLLLRIIPTSPDLGSFPVCIQDVPLVAEFHGDDGPPGLPGRVQKLRSWHIEVKTFSATQRFRFRLELIVSNTKGELRARLVI